MLYLATWAVVFIVLLIVGRYLDIASYDRGDYIAGCSVWPFVLVFGIVALMGVCIVWPIDKLGKWILGS